MDSGRIVQTYEVKGKKRLVYCIGPFCRRVSFVSQQHRALNLVWALKDQGIFDPGANIAVVGAGLAGLTAAAGFMAYGCDVDVFETSRETVSPQRHTEHRLVHPTINQWPEKPLGFTTELPFLEWFAGRCSTTTIEIAKQFERLRTGNAVYTKHEVKEISDIAAELVRLKVEPRVPQVKGYRLVVLAIGFGGEQTDTDFPNSPPYWYPDNVEMLRDQRKVERFLVSGCGDGGLIDALRIVHRGFRKGQLTFDLAHVLSGTPVAESIVKAEREARLASSTQLLEGAYVTAARMIESEPDYLVARSLLSDSLIMDTLVGLVDKELAAPFSFNAAPIHKLLVAHARLLGALKFVQSSLEKRGTKIAYGGREVAGEPETKVIIRHGPKPNVSNLLSDPEIADLEQKQRQWSDDHAEQLWKEPFPGLPGFPRRDVGDPEFVRNREPLARSAIIALSPNFELSLGSGKYRVRYKGDSAPPVPDALFGIPVEVATAAEPKELIHG